jgi:hypothetical protein
MSVKLNNDDRCAVDLILDRSSLSPGELNSCFSVGASNVLQERLTRVESLLKVLDHHPVPEPAADLLAKTIARCDQAADARAARNQQSHPATVANPTRNVM